MDKENISRETDLHEIDFIGCEACKLRGGRNVTQFGFCNEANGRDGLPVKCVGTWAKEKVWTVAQYVGIFAEAMKSKFDLNYLEICSGPGRCVTRNGVEMDGTPMAVLRSFAIKYFKSAVFIDKDKESVSILNKRIEALGLQEKAVSFVGDYNDTDSIDNAISWLKMNGRSLTLCVIDPYDCSMPFEVIKYVRQRMGKCDFIISYFDGLDAKRNFRLAISQKRGQELMRFSRFLGLSDLQMGEFINSKEVQDSLRKNNTTELMEHFAKCYEERLNEIGLSYIGRKSVRKGIVAGVEFYQLLFASANQCGLKFWNKIQSFTSTGQRQFPFM